MAFEQRPPWLRAWIDSYAEQKVDAVGADPEFRTWLEEEYVPIFGGWQY